MDRPERPTYSLQDTAHALPFDGAEVRSEIDGIPWARYCRIPIKAVRGVGSLARGAASSVKDVDYKPADVADHFAFTLLTPSSAASTVIGCCWSS